MAIFGKKAVSKGPQDDPKMVRVSLQFHSKTRAKSIFWFVERISLQDLF
jgi:hypothetical protein